MEKDLLKGLTKEQIEKIRTCQNQDEILKLAKDEGIQLSEEQLEAVNGGNCFSKYFIECPYCGKNSSLDEADPDKHDGRRFYCKNCKVYLTTEEVTRGKTIL